MLRTLILPGMDREVEMSRVKSAVGLWFGAIPGAGGSSKKVVKEPWGVVSPNHKDGQDRLLKRFEMEIFGQVRVSFHNHPDGMRASESFKVDFEFFDQATAIDWAIGVLENICMPLGIDKVGLSGYGDSEDFYGPVAQICEAGLYGSYGESIPVDKLLVQLQAIKTQVLPIIDKIRSLIPSVERTLRDMYPSRYSQDFVRSASKRLIAGVSQKGK